MAALYFLPVSLKPHPFNSAERARRPYVLQGGPVNRTCRHDNGNRKEIVIIVAELTHPLSYPFA